MIPPQEEEARKGGARRQPTFKLRAPCSMFVYPSPSSCQCHGVEVTQSQAAAAAQCPSRQGGHRKGVEFVTVSAGSIILGHVGEH